VQNNFWLAFAHCPYAPTDVRMRTAHEPCMHKNGYQQHMGATFLNTSELPPRAKPASLCPVENCVRSPLPDGRVDLNALLSGYINSGFAISAVGCQGKGWDKAARRLYINQQFSLMPRQD